MTVKKSNIKDVFPILSNKMTDFTLTTQNETFMQILNETLTPPQKRLFTESFGVYLKYDVDKDFVVDLDDHWKELGYSKKDKATDSIVKNLEVDVDYSHENNNIPSSQGICSDDNFRVNLSTSARRPKTKFFLTVSAYKILCSLAGTDQGKEIRKYFIAVEKATHA